MYLRSLSLKNLKLARALDISFLRGREPRMWTVLLGRNGLCKTSILQAIALAASGPTRAKLLADASVFPDRRLQAPVLRIDAEFGFNSDATHHSYRHYPGLDQRPQSPPLVRSWLQLDPGRTDFHGSSSYAGAEVEPTFQQKVNDEVRRRFVNIDQANLSTEARLAIERMVADDLNTPGPLVEARSLGLNLWFVAGYGIGRQLFDRDFERPADYTVDRLNSLFNRGSIIGTAFFSILQNGPNRSKADADEIARRYAATLKSILVGPEHLLPEVTNIELRGYGGVRRTADFIESSRFDFRAGERSVRLPAVALSQGYQAVIAWIADLVGQVFLESDGPIDPADMEGLVLIDELDLHLHPLWQVHLVKMLRSIFPKLQFVTTTHSPMILPYLQPDEVLVLDQNADGDVVIQPSTRSPALLTASDLLATYFGLDEIFPNKVGEWLWRYGYLARCPNRTPDEEREMRALALKLGAEGLDVSSAF